MPKVTKRLFPVEPSGTVTFLIVIAVLLFELPFLLFYNAEAACCFSSGWGRGAVSVVVP